MSSHLNNFDEYDAFVEKTSLCTKTDYYLAGLVEEVGEVAQLRRKQLKGVVIAEHDYIDELGDVLWYLVALIHASGHSSLTDVIQHNIHKIREKQK